MSILELEEEILLELQPEEVAGLIIRDINKVEERNQGPLNVSGYIHAATAGVPPQDRNKFSDILMEGWSWLIREGLIANKTYLGSEYFFVTRRGRSLKNEEEWQAYRHSDLLPKGLLHPSISTKVWSIFLRGDYDVAVLQAFKQVEVAVREAGHFEDTAIGVPLMRDAFNRTSGPLTEHSVPEAERQALSDLFAGAIGYYKNPHSHRQVIIKDPAEAVEMLLMASHLLRIVEDRANVPAPNGEGREQP